MSRHGEFAARVALASTGFHYCDYGTPTNTKSSLIHDVPFNTPRPFTPTADMRTLDLDSTTTALIVVDLQNGLLARPLAPHSSSTVLGNTVTLAEAVSAYGGYVIRVTMDFSDLPGQAVDAPSQMPKEVPTKFSELTPEIASLAGASLT